MWVSIGLYIRAIIWMGYIGIFSPVVENQMENEMEDELATIGYIMEYLMVMHGFHWQLGDPVELMFHVLHSCKLLIVH